MASHASRVLTLTTDEAIHGLVGCSPHHRVYEEHTVMDHHAYACQALCQDYMRDWPHEDVVASELRADMQEVVAYPPDAVAQPIVW